MTLPSYPLTILNGSLELTSSYPEKVRQSILSSLYTEVYERVYEPDYGLGEHIFTAVNSLTEILASLRDTISLGLSDYPDVTFSLRGAIADDGALAVQVSYQCPDTEPQTVTATLGATDG